jgi:hypothetical protein
LLADFYEFYGGGDYPERSEERMLFREPDGVRIWSIYERCNYPTSETCESNLCQGRRGICKVQLESDEELVGGEEDTVHQ